MSSTSGVAALAVGKSTVRWKIFVVMLSLIAINYIDRASLSVAMPFISKEFNIGPAMEGLILSSFFWTYACHADSRRHARRPLQAAHRDRHSDGVLGLLPGDRGGLHERAGPLLTRLGLGRSEAPIYPAGGKLNAIWMTQTERGRGATLLDGGAPLGAALGAILIAGLIAMLGSWRLAFVVAGVGTVLAGILAWFYIRNTPREHPGVNELEAEYIEECARTRRAHSNPRRSPAACAISSSTARCGACSLAGCVSTACSTACLRGCRITCTWSTASTSSRWAARASSSSSAASSANCSAAGSPTSGRLRAGVPMSCCARCSVSRRSIATVSIFSVAYVTRPGRRRRPALLHALLPALVRPVLVHPVDPRHAQQDRLSRRLDESRRQYRGHRGADHRRRDRAGHRLLFPRADVLRGRWRRFARVLRAPSITEKKIPV